MTTITNSIKGNFLLTESIEKNIIIFESSDAINESASKLIFQESLELNMNE